MSPGSDFNATLLVADLIGIAAFAASGALVGVRKGLDAFGVVVLGGVTGLGGGVMRDVLIGDTPPAALRDWRLLAVAAGAGLVVSFLHPAIGRRTERVINIFDAAGLSIFSAVGVSKAHDYHVGSLAAILLGVITGIGGGILRDLLAGRPPIVLREGLYAIPAAAGSAVTMLAISAGVDTIGVTLLGAAVCGVWRLLAMWRHWQAPMPQGPASV